MTHFFLADEAATCDFGRQLARVLYPGLVVYLHGTLGAGKTSLCRSIVRALGYSGAVKSPTYTLVEPYPVDGEGSATLYHFDLYRLAHPEELEFIGARDYFGCDALCLIEWPEKGLGFIPQADVIIELAPEKQGRRLVVTGPSVSGAELVNKINHFTLTPL